MKKIRNLAIELANKYIGQEKSKARSLLASGLWFFFLRLYFRPIRNIYNSDLHFKIYSITANVCIILICIAILLKQRPPKHRYVIV